MEALEHPEFGVINRNYEKACECLNAGQLEYEAGNKAQALVLYRLGRRHLLQGLNVNTHGPLCVGPDWDLARQLQLEMNETLSSITTRLAFLETTSSQGLPAAQRLYPNLPSLREPQRPPSSRVSPSAIGGRPHLDQPPSPALASDAPSELPPAYTPQPTYGHLSLSHNEGETWPSLPPPRGHRQGCTPVGHNGVVDDLLFLPHGVQIFFVAANGQVSAPSYPGYLRITLNNGQQRESGDVSDTTEPPAYLQVCDWHYPLFPDSPVLLSNTGVFTFPDTTATVPGSYVGVVLSPELPASDRALFQEHLSVLTQLRVQAITDDVDEGRVEASGTGAVKPGEKAPTGPLEDAAAAVDAASGKEEKTLPEWSEKMSQGILTGASWLSRGLVQGAEATGKAIHKGAVKLREHITPEETPAEVSPGVTRGLNVAKQATGGAAKVSHFLVEGLSTVVELVGKELTPHVKKHGSKLIPESLKKNKDTCTNMNGAKEVAVSSLKGLSTIWSGLETAAKMVGKSASSETVLTVKHKYGDEAGQAANTAVQSATNVGVTAFNMDNLGLKAVLKGAGKQVTSSQTGEDNAEESEKKTHPKEDDDKN